MSKTFAGAMDWPAEQAGPRPGLPRLVDTALALAGLVATSPLLLLAAAAVASTSPGPVFFRQQRIGRGGRSFTLLKLRTMTANAANAANTADTAGGELTAAGDYRITPVGRWLRRFKLDEIPQLWQVVRGDMSLVGPRPEVPRFVDSSDALWRQVLAARPGLTDPVTLRLRDEEALLKAAGGDDVEGFYRERLLPWKLRGYRDYLERRNWATDLAVLAATALAVVRLRRPKPLQLAEIDGREAR
ncbi:MAG TPA: sugar transferase [Thermoanaerobaculia bacterium]|nr:sugar transferase [Thermoanaerobaculia bacterium]